MADFSYQYLARNQKRPEIYFSCPISETVNGQSVTTVKAGHVSYVMSEYESLIWTERDRDTGDFELKFRGAQPEGIPFSMYSLLTPNLVSAGWYVSLPLDISSTFMIIEKIESEYNEEGITTVVSGRSIESILDYRVIASGSTTDNTHVKDSQNRWLWEKNSLFVTRYCPGMKEVGIKTGNQFEEGVVKNEALQAPLLHHIWSVFCLCFKGHWRNEQERVSKRRRLIAPDSFKMGEYYRPGNYTGEWNVNVNPEILYDPVARYSTMSASYEPGNNWYIPAATHDKKYNLYSNWQFKTTGYFAPMNSWTRYWSCETAESKTFRQMDDLYLSSAGFYNFGRKDRDIDREIYGSGDRAYYCPASSTGHLTMRDASVAIADIGGKSFLTWIKEMAETYDFRFKLIADPSCLVSSRYDKIDAWFLECMPSRDLSNDQSDTTTYAKCDPVIFSVYNRTLSSARFSYDTQPYRNSALVVGQNSGVGSSFPGSWFNDCTRKGMSGDGYRNADRREVYVDQSSSKMEDYGYKHSFDIEVKESDTGPVVGVVKFTIQTTFSHAMTTGNMKKQFEASDWTSADKAYTVDFVPNASWPGKNKPDSLDMWMVVDTATNPNFKLKDPDESKEYVAVLKRNSSKEIIGDKVENSYAQYLDYQGLIELADEKNGWNMAIEAEINQNNPVYVYGHDYNLGDYVSVETPFALGKKARVAEFIRSWDNDGYHEYPTFVYRDDSIYIMQD